jgi:hypothetical protein
MRAGSLRARRTTGRTENSGVTIREGNQATSSSNLGPLTKSYASRPELSIPALEFR